MKYIIPSFPIKDFPIMALIAVIGGLLSGTYGILHDQVTYTISEEYFTKLKFKHFAYADFGLGPRVFASTIGFLASWWVGLFAAWFIARRLIPHQPRARAKAQVRQAFLIVTAIGFSFSVLGFAYGLILGPEADYSSWKAIADDLEIEQLWAFIRVAYIHNASYLGGLVGLIVALISIRPAKPQSDNEMV